MDGHRIAELEEKPPKPKSSFIATAIYIFPPWIFPLFSQYCSEGIRDNLGSFITYLIDKDGVYAYTFNELRLDIGAAKALGSRVTINQSAKLVAKLLGKDKKLVYQEPRPSDVRYSLADISKARQIVYNLKYDLERGLRETIREFYNT